MTLCPACGSERCVPIRYGMPTPELFAQAERGEVLLGGCCVGEHDPEWACRRCEHHWGPVSEVAMEIELVWEGPHTLEQVIREMDDAGSSPNYTGEDYGLYQIYGRHILGGDDSLLYVGRATEQTFAERFRQHHSWLIDEEDVQIYLGRGFMPERHTPADQWASWTTEICLAENILIYKYSPHYNSISVANPPNLLGYDSVVLAHARERHRLHARDIAPDDWR